MTGLESELEEKRNRSRNQNFTRDRTETEIGTRTRIRTPTQTGLRAAMRQKQSPGIMVRKSAPVKCSGRGHFSMGARAFPGKSYFESRKMLCSKLLSQLSFLLLARCWQFLTDSDYGTPLRK